MGKGNVLIFLSTLSLTALVCVLSGMDIHTLVAGVAGGRPRERTSSEPGFANRSASSPKALLCQQPLAPCLNNPTAGKLCLDLDNLLGFESFVSGIGWQPSHCFLGLKSTFPAENQQRLQNMVEDILLKTQAMTFGVSTSMVDREKPYWSSLKSATPPEMQKRDVLTDPTFEKWQYALTRVLSGFALENVKRRSQLYCPGASWGQRPFEIADLPLPQCTPELSDEQLRSKVGFFWKPFLSINGIAKFVVDGFCTATFDKYYTFGEVVNVSFMSRMPAMSPSCH